MKSVDKTKDIQDKTISYLEVKQLGECEYIKGLEKKPVDKEKSLHHYIGVKQSEYLKSQGVPRQIRKTTLE
ncbi:hypothetical protein SFC08_05970 [Lysinibacillus halotolerans]